MKKRIIIISILLLILLFSYQSGIMNLKFFSHIGASLYRMIIGYTFSVILGFIFAILIGVNKYIRWALKPLLSFFISIPTIAWVPVLLVITGIGETTILVTIFLGAFFPIVFNIIEGFDRINLSIIRVGEIMGYSPLKILIRIKIPASFNNILVGLKLGISYSWRALVGAEMLAAADYGLGYTVFASRQFYDYRTMFLALFFIGVIGYYMNRTLVVFLEEKTISRWGLR